MRIVPPVRGVCATAVAVSATAAVLGTLHAVRRAVNLPPAEAVRPEPPSQFRPTLIERIRTICGQLARALHVSGLMNVQLAVKGQTVYILEVKPRASRTVPFVAKAKGVPWANLAAKVMMGASLKELGVEEVPNTGFFSVKEVVLPFAKFPGVDVILGPEMRSTGEVMGVDRDFAAAFAKAQAGAGEHLNTRGAVLITVRDQDKHQTIYIAKKLAALGVLAVAGGALAALALGALAGATDKTTGGGQTETSTGVHGAVSVSAMDSGEWEAAAPPQRGQPTRPTFAYSRRR